MTPPNVTADQGRHGSDALNTPASVSLESETLIRYYYAEVDHAPENVHRLFTENTIYRRPGYEPLMGRADIKRFYRDDRVILEGVHSLSTIVVNGDHVAVSGRFTGRDRSNNSIRIEFADFFTVRGGFIDRRTTYFHVPGV